MTDAIPPGGDGKIEVSLDTRGQPGSLRKTVAVFSNDPRTPRYELVLQADVSEDVRIVPSFVNFGEVLIGSTAAAQVSLEVLDPKQVDVADITSDDKRFSFNKSAAGDDSKSTWEITFQGGSRKGPVDARLFVRTSGTGYPQIEVPMHADLVGSIRSPSQIYFYHRDGTYHEQEILLEGRDKTPFKIIGVTDPDDRLRFQVVRDSPTRSVIKASLKDPTRPIEKTITGTLRVRTTGKRDPLLEIDYRVMRSQKK